MYNYPNLGKMCFPQVVIIYYIILNLNHLKINDCSWLELLTNACLYRHPVDIYCLSNGTS